MLLNYIIAMAVACLAIFIGIILGDYGPWYLSWFLGTGFMILLAVSAGVLFEAQEDARQASDDASAAGASDVAKVVAGASAPRPGGGTRG